MIDTGAFLAQRSPRDQYHARAVKGFNALASSPIELYSTEHVLNEVMTLLAQRESYAYAAEAGEELIGSQVLQWLDATNADWRAALKMMRKYADQRVSFTDCISFALMRRQGIKHVFGFDRHFSAAGFKVLLGEDI